MEKRKHLSDFAVNIYSKSWVMFTADQVTKKGSMDDECKKISTQCHIYVICTRPKLQFDPVSFNFDAENSIISGKLIYRQEGIEIFIPFETVFDLVDGATNVALSKYPYRELVTMNDAGEIIRYLPAYALSLTLGQHRQIPALQNLKVAYVGQAFGKGKRTALERLRSHSTLQKILAETHYHSPDDDVFILTFEYCPYRIISKFDGRNSDEAKTVNDAKRFKNIINNPLSTFQQICLTEAALIRFFKPEFNTIYKESFPEKDMKILRECNDLDFSSLIVEINTDELEFSLYSDDVGPRMHHMANFDLVEYVQRIGFFHY